MATVEGDSTNPVALSPADVKPVADTVGVTSPARTVTLLASGTGSGQRLTRGGHRPAGE